MATLYEAIKNGELGIDHICQTIAVDKRFHYILDEYVVMNCCFDDGNRCKYYCKEFRSCDIYMSEDFASKCPKYRENANAIRRIMLDWFNTELGS